MEAYLQHGKAGEPMRTERLDAVRITEAPKSGVTQTGYGSKLPTPYEVKWNGRWYRVYGICYGNSGSFYIKSRGKRIFVTFYD